MRLYLSLFLFLLTASLVTSEYWMGKAGTTTTTWDGCVPACAYHKTVLACDRHNNPLIWNKERGKQYANACFPGEVKEWSENIRPRLAFTCDYFQPRLSHDERGVSVSVGFAGNSDPDNCGSCFRLQWTGGPARGQEMVVMVINNGGVPPDGFDLYMAGGGPGDYDATALKYNYKEKEKKHYEGGRQRGGTTSRSDCGKIDNPQLKAGCLWRYDWANDGSHGLSLNEAPIKYKEEQCPKILLDIADGSYARYVQKIRQGSSGGSRYRKPHHTPNELQIREPQE